MDQLWCKSLTGTFPHSPSFMFLYVKTSPCDVLRSTIQLHLSFSVCFPIISSFTIFLSCLLSFSYKFKSAWQDAIKHGFHDGCERETGNCYYILSYIHRCRSFLLHLSHTRLLHMLETYYGNLSHKIHDFKVTWISWKWWRQRRPVWYVLLSRSCPTLVCNQCVWLIPVTVVFRSVVWFLVESRVKIR